MRRTLALLTLLVALAAGALLAALALGVVDRYGPAGGGPFGLSMRGLTVGALALWSGGRALGGLGDTVGRIRALLSRRGKLAARADTRVVATLSFALCLPLWAALWAAPGPVAAPPTPVQQVAVVALPDRPAQPAPCPACPACPTCPDPDAGPGPDADPGPLDAGAGLGAIVPATACPQHTTAVLANRRVFAAKLLGVDLDDLGACRDEGQGSRVQRGLGLGDAQLALSIPRRTFCAARSSFLISVASQGTFERCETKLSEARAKPFEQLAERLLAADGALVEHLQGQGRPAHASLRGLRIVGHTDPTPIKDAGCDDEPWIKDNHRLSVERARQVGVVIARTVAELARAADPQQRRGPLTLRFEGHGPWDPRPVGDDEAAGDTADAEAWRRRVDLRLITRGPLRYNPVTCAEELLRQGRPSPSPER